MLREGQFDTAYHEHISFFSGHSFAKAAELAGLHILEFEQPRYPTDLKSDKCRAWTLEFGFLPQPKRHSGRRADEVQ